MIESLASLTAVLAVLCCAYVPGRYVVRAWCGPLDALAAATWSVAVGMIFGGMLWGVLGVLGLLDATLILLLTVGGALGGVVLIYHDAQAWRRANDEDSAAPVQAPGRDMIFGGVGLGVLAVLGSLVSALAPPTAGDALCYHLELPKTFLLAGGLSELPFDDNATYPLLTEMLYMWGLAIEGGVTAQLMHWVLGLLLAAGAIDLARPILGWRWSTLVGVVVLLVPGVSNQMTAPLNDVGLAAFSTLALAAGQRAWRKPGGGGSWWLVTGLMWGAAAATKYTALLFVPAVGAAVAYAWLRQAARRRELLWGAATVLCVAMSVAGMWYVRAAWYRGNPVYPFLSGLIGVAGPDGQADKTPLGGNPVDMVRAAWDITMQPERFGGRGHELGPLFLAMLPALVFVRRLRGLGPLLAIAGVYGAQWYLLRQNVRFLLPLVPIGAIGVVWCWAEMRQWAKWPRAIGATAMVGMLALGALFPLVRARDELLVAVGLESRQKYLEQNEPTYAAARLANEMTSGDARLLSQDYRGYYFDCLVTRESVYRRCTNYDRKLETPAELSRELRARGFTHVLLAETVAGEGIWFDETLARLVEEAQEAGDEGLSRLLDYEILDRDGTRRRYQLLALRR